MRLNIINQFSIETGNEIVRRLRTRKTEELLVYLALHQSRWVSRAELTELLWSSDDEASARQKLRLALHSIRGVLNHRLESDGDLVRVSDVEVDFEQASLRNLGAGWRLMPGHQAEWLDLIAASGEARQQLNAISAIGTPNPDRAASLAYLIATDPGEPDLYKELFDHYHSEGSRAAAGVVASFARINLGRNCPPALAATTTTQIRSDFVGRLRELTTLAGTLLGNKEPAAVQLNGVGGMGKSRLAAELAALAPAEELPVVWVSLEGVQTEAGLETKLVAALSDSLGLAPDEAADPQEIPSILVILDNADNLPMGALAPTKRYLQEGCGLRLLLTSQLRRSEFESSILLQPLGLPRGRQLDQVQNSEAVSLLAHLSIKPVTDANLESYLVLAEEAGGVPLALSMIGSEARHRPLSELAESLRNSAKQLKFGPGNEGIPDRHLSLESTLRWSFQLLSKEEQLAAQKLSAVESEFDSTVFPQLGIEPGLVSRLVSTNWVTESGTEGVFCLLPPIKKFLRQSAPDIVASASANVKRFLVQQIQLNYPENYAAVSAVAERYQADFAMLQAVSSVDDLETRGALLVGLQVTAHRYGRVEVFLAGMEQLLAEYENPHWRNLLGNAEYLRRDFDAANSHFLKVVDSDDPELASVAKCNLALVMMSTGEPATAVALLQQSIVETKNLRRRGARLINLCSCYCLLGRHEEAKAAVNDAQEIFEELAELRSYLALCYQRRAEALLLNGEVEAAHDSALIALDGYEQIRQWHHMSELYMLLTLIAATLKEPDNVKKWAFHFLDHKPEVASLCGTMSEAMKRLGAPGLGERFSQGVDHERLPILLKCTFESRKANTQFHPRSHWYALARQSLKHL